MSRREISLALSGLGLLVAGVWVAPTALPVGPVLISLGAVVLLVGFAFPLVTQVELGLPSLFKVSLVASERSNRLHSLVEDCRGLLVACAVYLCPDADSALRAVEATVSDALALWHGTDREALRRYVLCTLVHQSRFEARSLSAEQIYDRGTFLSLSLREREVIVLTDRAGLDEQSVAGMLGEEPAEISRIHAAAIASLAPLGGLR